jgi:hypothetical protein
MGDRDKNPLLLEFFSDDRMPHVHRRYLDDLMLALS